MRFAALVFVLAAVADAKPRPPVQDTLTSDQIQHVMMGNRKALRACYAAQLKDHPDLEGKWTYAVTVGAKGVVAKVVMRAAQPTSITSFDHCLVKAIKSFKFPKANMTTTFEYPLVFAKQI